MMKGLQEWATAMATMVATFAVVVGVVTLLIVYLRWVDPI